MRILLVLPPNIGRYVVATIPHAGVAYLAAILEKGGHEVGLQDMRLYPNDKDLFEKIKQFNPDMIGMSTASFGYKKSYEIINKIKNRFSIPLAVGGSYTSVAFSKILEDTKADYAVYGEGEQSFLDLANKMALKDIKGLIWRNNGEITKNPPYPMRENLDELPYPKYEIFELDKMLEKRIPIVSSRGCPGRCTFCSIQLVFGRPFRTRSPENVVGEIKKWHKKGYDTFEFSDDNFTHDMQRAEKICDLIIESGMKLKLIFGNGLRADRVNERLLRKLKQAGTIFIAYGLETSDPKSLELIKKDLDIEKLKESVRLTKKIGIQAQVNFIIGCPEQTFKTFKEDLRFAEELNADQLRFYNLVPYLGTELFEWIKKNGKFLYQPEEFLNSLDYWGEEPVFETENFTKEERIKAYRLGQDKIMEIFLKRHFGKSLGRLGFKVWKTPFVQKYGKNIATKGWILLKKLRLKQT
ncbi:hypothetical protein CMO94_04420 [Candidatus Woesearchaeota archaeon]|jgi:radical SAM superfamily enzyme YgiQ (UPF0313 family)|nr:hypothetical protein [Candidatus Woesearchaeota archaeon]|tara:strand:+ start:474 stop:1874 length:1401 start_codon:yes stop_codon:yes gene_type:complete